MADVSLARKDLGAFAEMLLGRPLAEWQVAGLRFVTFITCLLAGRQMGKSLCACVVALWWALRKPDQVVLLVGASEEGSRRLLRTALDLLRASPFAVSLTEESGSTARLSNGSRLIAPAASEFAIRGLAADLVVGDEAQLWPESQYAAVLPTLTAREGSRLLLTGTASVASGTFFNNCAAGLSGEDEHVRTHRWVAKQLAGDCAAPWVRAEVVEAARATMSPAFFAGEYLCEFASGMDHVFSRALLDRVTADYEVVGIDDWRPAARASTGIDWGASRDRTVCIGLAAFAGLEETVWGIPFLERFDAGYPLPQVIRRIAGTPGHLDTINAEANALQAGLVQYLWEAWAKRLATEGGPVPQHVVLIEEDVTGPDPFAPPKVRRRPREEFATRRVRTITTAALKAAGFGALRLLFERERLLIPATPGIVKSELLMLQSQMTEGGGEKIAASVGHDDVAMALMLATVPNQVNGRWTNYIGDLTDRTQRPASHLPPGAGEMATAEAGGGRVVPRSPIWQSVAGRELTLPENFVRVDPLARSRREMAARVRALIDDREEAPGART